MKFTVFRLKPLSPFHIGEAGIGIERTESFIHSDTLASAIFNAWIVLYGSLDELNLEKDEGAGFPFRVSSAFPYIKDTLLFPKPHIPFSLPEGLSLKDWKKMRFIPENAFRKILRGDLISAQDMQIEVQKEKRDVAELLRESIIKKAVPRVAIGPFGAGSSIYYSGLVYFSEGTGLYFLADFDNEETKEKFINVIEFLGDTGIGGLRSTGCGYFSFDRDKDICEIEIDPPDTPTHYINLSLLFPDEETLKNLSFSFYQLIYRAGYSYSITDGKEIQRKQIWMLAEGSVFKNKPSGKILDLAPDNEKLSHPVYRYGLSFALPMEVRNAD